ncbi:MAG TPA: LuxR C-terminal-related transcriptional regulator [Candidatus Nanoarchaeia archaeon]|nr:LuxR C-terminal-related transcriptional regulator [Candidatus Nanoarchaeia archaeon]
MLSDKELEVLKLRKQGLKQSEIAKKLKISQPAVSSFEKNAYRKIREASELLEIIKKLGIDMP